MDELNTIIKVQRDNRKLLLFSVACCYEIIHLMDERSANAVKVAEMYADGLATEKQLLDARYAIRGATYPVYAAHSAVYAATNATNAATNAANAANAAYYAAHAAAHAAADSVDRAPARVAQLEMAKDIFGRGPTLPKTTAVTSIAEAVYLDKRFGELPVLADALEEAGCEDVVTLDHLRSGKRHWRGCWVLDLCGRTTNMPRIETPFGE